VFAVRLPGFTETVTDPGVGPFAVADSQEPPEVVAAVAVNAIPEVPPTVMGCEAGGVCPVW